MKVAIVSVLLITLSGLSQEPRRQSAPPVAPPAASPSGRYQIVAATLDDGISQKTQTVFLINTQTGNVWKYQEAFTATDTDGTKKIIPAAFVPVDVGAPSIR